MTGTIPPAAGGNPVPHPARRRPANSPTPGITALPPTGAAGPGSAETVPRPAAGRPATPPTSGTAAVPDTRTAGPGSAETPRRPAAKPAAAPITGKPHKPCSSPPKRPRAAYDHKPAAGPGRAPRRTQHQSAQPPRVRVELPREPPPLNPQAALALLRALLNARTPHDTARPQTSPGHRPDRGQRPKKGKE